MSSDTTYLTLYDVPFDMQPAVYELLRDAQFDGFDEPYEDEAATVVLGQEMESGIASQSDVAMRLANQGVTFEVFNDVECEGSMYQPQLGMFLYQCDDQGEVLVPAKAIDEAMEAWSEHASFVAFGTQLGALTGALHRRTLAAIRDSWQGNNPTFTVFDDEREEDDEVSTVYVGGLALDEFGTKICIVEVNGEPLTHHVKHSPSGFAWGYNGSGPAELARCLIIDALGEPAAWCPTCKGRGTVASGGGGELVCPTCWGERTSFTPATYQRFKEEVVSRWPRDEPWRITRDEILRHVDRVRVS